MYALYEANANGDGSSHLVASLLTKTPGDGLLQQDYVHLIGGDELVAGLGSQTHVMDGASALGVWEYSADFTADTEGTTFTVALERQNGESAPGSSIVMPSPFQLTAPDAFSRAQALMLQFSPPGKAGDQIGVTVNGTCGSAHLGPVSDVGTLIIVPGSITPSSPEQAGATCQVTVQAKRVRKGQTDPAYGRGGSATGSQTRSIVLTSTP
jgi:hypothetical protein